MDKLLIRRAIIVFVGLFLLIALVVTLAGIGNDSTPVVEEPSPAQILGVNEYDTPTSMVRFTVDGPIIAREEHVRLVISVTSSQRKIQVFKGYEGKVLKSKTYSNDSSAYKNFLSALAYTGFDNERVPLDGIVDDIGTCSRGRRYISEIFDNDNQIKRLWQTSCSRAQGTSAGVSFNIKNLFFKQIPKDDYREITRGLGLQ